MKKKYLLALLLVLCGSCAFAQGRIYTRKARLEDFPSRTTRVVLTGQEVFDAVLKEEEMYALVIDPSDGFDTGTVESWLETNNILWKQRQA